MRVAVKEGDDPVVNEVWQVEPGHFLHERGMFDSVKRFAEINCYDDHIRVGQE